MNLRSCVLLLAAVGLTSANGAEPTVEIIIPPGLSTCGVFQDGRPLALEHQLKCRLRLREGRFAIPVLATEAAADLVESLEFGPEGEPGTALAPGVFKLTREPGANCAPGAACYRISFVQDWVAGGVRVHLQDWNGFLVQVKDGVVSPREFRISEELISQGAFLHGMAGDDPEDYQKAIRFSSCSYQELPLWNITVELAGGDRAFLEERYQVPVAGSGPAQLLRGEVLLDGQERVQTDYFKLVYAAEHHNWNESYWVLFDEPLTVRGLTGVRGFFVQEGFGEAPRRAALLGPDLKELKTLEVLRYEQRLAGTPPPAAFVRGDGSGDGQPDISDAVAILGSLFLGVPHLDCPDAGDVDDSGAIDISDPINLLDFLFLGGPSPGGPFPGCGEDPSPDGLPACSPTCNS